MTKEVVEVKGVSPSAPFSPAVRANGFVFTAGHVGSDRERGGAVAEGDIREQTRQTLVNLGKTLEAAGLGFEDVVKCNVYLVDMADFAGMNEVYRTFFPQDPPARTTVGNVTLASPRLLVEIECVAACR